MKFRTVLAGLITAGFLAGCSGESADQGSNADTSEATPFEEQLRLALETAQPGDVIDIPAGTFEFDRGLTLNTDGVTIRGAGMAESVLTFKNQLAGAEGLLVNASDFTIEDLGIEDAKGDALKINEGKNITIRRVRTEWTNGPSTDNGAYGIYPVQTENVLIDGAVAIGASDAGIYVGQSRTVVVRNSVARLNVAGIEIENTVHADVYDNEATENTGGILVFNMPDLPQEGHSTRVYNNRINNNNTPNFAAPGTAVAGVPAGSGVIINANDRVEIFANEISGNNSASILISSFYSAGYASRDTVETFDPYPEQINIYDNQMSGAGAAGGAPYLEQLRVALFGESGSLPDILWDGYVNEENASGPQICVAEDVTLLNIDTPNEHANPSTDMAPYRCTLEKLEPVTLAAL